MSKSARDDSHKPDSFLLESKRTRWDVEQDFENAEGSERGTLFVFCRIRMPNFFGGLLPRSGFFLANFLIKVLHEE